MLQNKYQDTRVVTEKMEKESIDTTPCSVEDDGADFIRSHIEFIDMQKDKIVHKDPVDEMEKYYEQYYYGRGSDA